MVVLNPLFWWMNAIIISPRAALNFKCCPPPVPKGPTISACGCPNKKSCLPVIPWARCFPNFPNLFTMRGEKMRKPMEYIHSLDKMIALDAEMLVPSHHSPITGKDNIRNGLTRIRDAVQYVHDATIAGNERRQDGL